MSKTSLSLLAPLLVGTLLLSGCASVGKLQGSPAAALASADVQAARAALADAKDPEAQKQARIARNRAIRGLCGTVRVRDEGWRNRLADEVAKLPPDSIIIEALDDGSLAREAQRVCRGEYEGALQ